MLSLLAMLRSTPSASAQPASSFNAESALARMRHNASPCSTDRTRADSSALSAASS